MTSHLEREIHEQPIIIANLLESQRSVARHIAQAIRAFEPHFVCIAARGTSDNAARYAQYLLATRVRKLVALATPSVHTLYEVAPNLSRALVIGISQSGQSEDIRCVLADAQEQGALTLSITNAPQSPLAQLAQYHLDLCAGQEISVAATKSYTAQLAAIALLAAEWAQDTAMSDELAQLPAWLRATLSRYDDMPQWVERYRYAERFAVLGRGYNFCTAYEISLKVKELCYVTAEGYSEADFRHGPIAMIQAGFPVLIVAPQGRALANMRDLLDILGQKQAERLVITNEASLSGTARRILPIPAQMPEWLTPLTCVIPGQLFAMHLAHARDLPLDNPRGLTKVTNTQ